MKKQLLMLTLVFMAYTETGSAGVFHFSIPTDILLEEMVNVMADLPPSLPKELEDLDDLYHKKCAECKSKEADVEKFQAANAAALKSYMELRRFLAYLYFYDVEAFGFQGFKNEPFASLDRKYTRDSLQMKIRGDTRTIQAILIELAEKDQKAMINNTVQKYLDLVKLASDCHSEANKMSVEWFKKLLEWAEKNNIDLSPKRRLSPDPESDTGANSSDEATD